jgi:hypothetical protein
LPDSSDAIHKAVQFNLGHAPAIDHMTQLETYLTFAYKAPAATSGATVPAPPK